MKRVMVVVLLSGLIALLTMGLSGCGSSTQPIAVGITSSGNGTDQAQAISITATVTHDAKGAGVQWSVSGGGTLSSQTPTSVTYNAPASVTSAFTATVTAASITDTTKSASVQIKVSPPPTIATTSLPAATAGIAYSSTLIVSGGTAPFHWTVISGTLPAGLTLSSTGVISGIPTGASSGSVTFQVTDHAGISASQAITVTVNPPAPLTITTASLPGATLGTAYSQLLQATGGVPSYQWSVTAGSLPAGLSLSSAGVISGTPSGTTGTSSFTVKVTDSQTPTPATKTANLSITVSRAPLSVTTTSLLGGGIGNAYSQTLQATGGTPPYTWSITAGTLPAGLTLTLSTGDISGTPTATGTSSFTVRVTDSTTPTAGTATAALSITINAALAITTTTLPGGSVHSAYSATVNASGGVQPYAWSVTSGSLPAGLSINSGTGVISGTPTATGTSHFTVTATDSESPVVQANAALSIAIASASCPNNGNLTGHYAMVFNGWSSATTVTATVGSFIADGAGNISSGSVDLNDQINGPTSSTFTGTYCVTANNLATINLIYGTVNGTNTFAAALNSSGSNGNIIYYDSSNQKATGLLRKQDTTAFSTGKIKGNYAFGLVGASGGAGRYAMAGAFSADGSGNLAGEFDRDIFLTGSANATLSSSNLSVASASSGRGTATITFTGQSTLNFIFYVVSASELLIMENDSVGNSLLTGQVLQQTGSFTDASLNGVSVIEIESLSSGTTPAAAAGLVTTNGSGAVTNWSSDQNLGGTISSMSQTGTYSTSSDGRVTLSLIGQSSPPVFYLIGANQAFVVGTNPLTVDFGVVEPQSGSNFTKSSLTGAYQGGSLQPVNANVREEIDAVQADGNGNFSETSDSNGSGGTSTNTLTATYAVSSNGRVVVSQSGSQIGIAYLISGSQFVFLPASATDTNPKLTQFQH